jgi:hypothetical protein
MSHYTNPKRYWFTERGKLAFVEGGSSTTVDGVTSNLVSISEAKSCVVKGITLPNVFPTGPDEDYETSLTDTSAGPLQEIPLQFHEALAYKAIAIGYQDPRNMKIELAQYFNNEYDKVCRSAKKYARSNFQSTGKIAPQEF